MGWEGIAAIVSIVSLLIVVGGVVYNWGKMSVKINTLWKLIMEDGRSQAQGIGMIQRHSDWSLTQEGYERIPEGLMADIQKLIKRYKNRSGLFSRGMPDTWEVMDELGGTDRLSKEAAEARLSPQVLVALVGTYIDNELKKAQE